MRVQTAPLSCPGRPRRKPGVRRRRRKALRWARTIAESRLNSSAPHQAGHALETRATLIDESYLGSLSGVAFATRRSVARSPPDRTHARAARGSNRGRQPRPSCPSARGAAAGEGALQRPCLSEDIVSPFAPVSIFRARQGALLAISKFHESDEAEKTRKRTRPAESNPSSHGH